MLIQELYDALDQLEEDARSIAESFAGSGDLTALSSATANLGARGYMISNSADQIIAALKFE